MTTLAKIEEALKGGDLETAEVHVQAVRARPDAQPHERSMAALRLAVVFYEQEMLVEAEVWALRALQGDLRVDALCLLGEVAWDRLDYESAIGFYEAASAVTRAPVVCLDLVQDRQRRLAEMYQESVKLVRPARFVERHDTDHALVIQSLGERSNYREGLFLSLEAAGVERWRGPKILVIDGHGGLVKTKEERPGWLVTGSSERQGQAQTYFEALRRAVDTGAKRITFFEDDVLLAKNALDYIAQVEPLQEAPLIAWWNRMPAPFRAGPPMFLLTPNCSFVRNVALSMSAETARKLLDSEVVKNWDQRHAGDMIYADALPGAQAALHFPGIVQHIGNESTVGKTEIRQSRSFIGKDTDAMRLFDATGP